MGKKAPKEGRVRRQAARKGSKKDEHAAAAVEETLQKGMQGESIYS